MVEINNQRKAFLDMLAVGGNWYRTSENQKSWLWRHCRRWAIYWLLRSPSQTCHAKPKPKSTGAGRYQLLSRWWDAYRKQLGLKDFSRKVRTLWHCSRLRSVARFTYDWSWWYPSGNRPLQQISGLHCRALVMVVWSIRLTAWLVKFKEAGGTVRELMYEQSHRDYLRSGYLHHRLPVAYCDWLFDNATPYWAACWTVLRTRQLLTCRCVSVMLLRSMQHTKELADKAENDALRDDVAAGRRRLHIKAVCQSVWSHHAASGVDNAASPRLADTAERDYFTLRERADHYAKTTGRNPEVY